MQVRHGLLAAAVLAVFALGACDEVTGTPGMFIDHGVDGGAGDISQGGKDTGPVGPDQGTPDTGGNKDVGEPDAPTADQALPDQALADQALPDQMLPDQILPDQVLPDLLAPDLVAPDLIPHDQGYPAVVILTTSPLKHGLVNVPYSVAFTATGGAGPSSYSWSGTVPTWATLNPTTGVLTGTPNSPGVISLTIKVVSGYRSHQKVFSLSVASPLTLSAAASPFLQATCAATSKLVVSNLFSGGLGPYTCTVYSGPGQGTFPSKLAYDTTDSTGCTLTGGFDATKDLPGTYGFFVTVADAVGQKLDVPITCKNGDCPATVMKMSPAIWPPAVMSPTMMYKWLLDLNDVNVLCKDPQCNSCGTCSNTIVGISSPLTADPNLDCTKPGDICLFNSKLGIITSCPSITSWHGEPMVKAHTAQRAGGLPSWNAMSLTITYSGGSLAPCGNKKWACHWDTLEK